VYKSWLSNETHSEFTRSILTGAALAMASPVLTAYYPSWKIYKGYKPSDLRLDLLNYVCYAFARYESPVSVSLDALDL
jgi:GH18 family chitinase